MNTIRFQLWFVFMFTATTGLATGVCVWLNRSMYGEREIAMNWLAVSMAISPAVLFAVPRSWLESPRALFFAWWPMGPMCAATVYFGDDRGYEISAAGLFVSSFFAMFTPTIVVGLRRARKNVVPESPDRG